MQSILPIQLRWTISLIMINHKNVLTIKTDQDDVEQIFQFCRENNIDLKIDIFDRTKKPTLYEELPHLLKKYSIYVDIRVVNDKIVEILIKTSLESPACGLKVLNYQLEYINRLPEIYNAINVINQPSKYLLYKFGIRILKNIDK